MNEQGQKDYNGKAEANQQQENQTQPLNKPETSLEQDAPESDSTTQDRQDSEQNSSYREKPMWDNQDGSKQSEQEHNDENAAGQDKLQKDEEKDKQF